MSFWNKLHISHQKKLASDSPSKPYVPYTNITLHYFVSSSTYRWFSYWAFSLSTLYEFLTICSNSSSSVIHTCLLSILIFFISLSPWGNMIFITQKGYKNDSEFCSIPSPSQEVLEYLQKHTLVLHVQKPYQVRPANSTTHDYLGLVQFDLVDT